LPFGSGAASDFWKLGTGSSLVLFFLSSLRSLVRSQPLWTKVSLSSGRTSDTVTCRSTLGAAAWIQPLSAPAPITAVSERSGLETYESACPAGLRDQW
jgi:hypothetical protein